MANKYTNIQAREVDFVTRFGSNWDALRDILGIARPVKKSNGTELKYYKSSMPNGLKTSPQAGKQIEFSDVEIEEVRFGTVTVEKYAKKTPIEEVTQYGADVAIERSDDAFLNELQTNVLTRFYAFLNTGSLTGSENDFQMALSMAKGKVLDKFKKMRKTVTEVVGFVNVLDVYRYIGAANVTIQTAFGIQYIKDFMGYKTLFLLSAPDIAEGTVIATPVENIIYYYVDPEDSDFAKMGLQYQVDGETPLIGFHVEGNYGTASGESYALMGITLMAEYLDGISVLTFGSTSNSGTEGGENSDDENSEGV